MEIFTYFNPTTNHHTFEHLSRLTWKNFAVTLCVSALAAIITFPILGLGGIATLRLMAEWLDPVPGSAAGRTNQVYQNVIRSDGDEISQLLEQGRLDDADQTRLVQQEQANAFVPDLVAVPDPVADNPVVQVPENQVVVPVADNPVIQAVVPENVVVQEEEQPQLEEDDEGDLNDVHPDAIDQHLDELDRLLSKEEGSLSQDETLKLRQLLGLEEEGNVNQEENLEASAELPPIKALNQKNALLAPFADQVQKLLEKSIKESLIQVKKEDPNFPDKCAQNFYKNLETDFENMSMKDRVHYLSIIFDNQKFLGCLGKVVKENKARSIAVIAEDVKKEGAPSIELSTQEFSDLKEKFLGERRKPFLINNLTNYDPENLESLKIILTSLEDKKPFPEPELIEIISIIVHKYYQKCVKEISSVLEKPNFPLRITIPRLENFIRFFKAQKVMITEDYIARHNLSAPAFDDDFEDETYEPNINDAKEHEAAMNALEKAGDLYRINSDLTKKMNLASFKQALIEMNDVIKDIDGKSFIYPGAKMALKELVKKFINEQHEFNEEIKVQYLSLAVKMDDIFEKEKSTLVVQGKSGMIKLKATAGKKVGEFQKLSLVMELLNFDLQKIDLDLFQAKLVQISQVLADVDQKFIFDSTKFVLKWLVFRFLIKQHEFDQERLKALKVFYQALADEMGDLEFEKLGTLIGISNFDLKKFDLDMFQSILEQMKKVLADVDGGFVYNCAQFVLQTLIVKLYRFPQLLDIKRLNEVIKPLYNEIAKKFDEKPLMILRPDGRSYDNPNADDELALDMESLEANGFSPDEINVIIYSFDPELQRAILENHFDPQGVQIWMNKYSG